MESFWTNSLANLPLSGSEKSLEEDDPDFMVNPGHPFPTSDQSFKQAWIGPGFVMDVGYNLN